MTLYFENSQGQRRVIGNPNTEPEAMAIIKEFLADHNYKSYYTRKTFNTEKNEITYDVGSWSEFFILEGYQMEK